MLRMTSAPCGYCCAQLAAQCQCAVPCTVAAERCQLDEDIAAWPECGLAVVPKRQEDLSAAGITAGWYTILTILRGLVAALDGDGVRTAVEVVRRALEWQTHGTWENFNQRRATDTTCSK